MAYPPDDPAYSHDDLVILATLIAELRGRLPPDISHRAFQDVGIWMMKAYDLGAGMGDSVLRPDPVSLDARSHLRIVK